MGEDEDVEASEFECPRPWHKYVSECQPLRQEGGWQGPT